MVREPPPPLPTPANEDSSLTQSISPSTPRSLATDGFDPSSALLVLGTSKGEVLSYEVVVRRDGGKNMDEVVNYLN
jgi:hypothetical protein